MSVAEADRRCHVVMLVANDITADTRVRKSALAVAATGARVTVVGIASGARREETLLGDVRLLRVPVDFVLRDRRRDRRARLHRGEIGFLVRDPGDEALARRRIALAEREAASGDGASAELARRVAHLRRLTLRAGARGRREAARAATLAFKVYDRGVQRTAVGADPRRVVPEVDDYELAVGPVLDELAPDVIHAHDVHFLAVAARAVARARRRGRTVRWLYDAHEWVPGLSRYGGRTERVVAAWAALEKDWVRSADRVVTVSPPLAEALRARYRLDRLPDVVLNVPPLGSSGSAGDRAASVRRAAGLDDGVPLLVYSGGVQAARGVETAVEALVHLPDAHLAVVAVPSVHTPAVAAVRTRAEQLGVSDRLHVLPPVPPDQVVAFLTGADVGVIPLKHFGSHEMALANKLFEYLHAGVPMVVSDCRAQAEFVREHGVGEVHRAGDGADLAAAVRRVLAESDSVRQRMTDPALLERYTWQAQARTLQRVHRELAEGLVRDGAPLAPLLADVPPLAAAEPPERDAGTGTTTLVVGPANSAGQAWAWTRAAAAHVPGVTGYALAIRNERYDYPADELVGRDAYLSDGDWQLRTLARARASWTHVLLEAGRPVLGGLVGRDFTGDADLLRGSGIAVGLVFHGSEVRDPRRHRLTHEFSPFTDPKDELTRSLQARCDALLPQVRRYAADHPDVPLLASTPDQLAYLPDGARWLPVVVDTARFTPDGAPVPLERPVPLFVHAPSNPRLKGTADVERVLRPLADRGLIELRMVTGMAPHEAAELIRTADVVVDQLLLGLYGVLACEAMASGRVVLGHLGDALRGSVEVPVPVIETTPRTLDDVVERLLDDRDAARDAAAVGPGFVAEVHDGRRSAAVIANFLGAQPADDEGAPQ